MSIKKIRNFGLILCCILLCVCAVGMFTVVPKTYADDDVTPITLSELKTFTTTDGGSIRTESPTGIRFATSISQDEYNGLVKEYGLKNLEFGMAIARVGSLEELKAADTAKTLKPMSYWMAGAYPGSGAQNYKYSFAIVSINEDNYNRQYTTIGYVKVGEEIVYAKDKDGQEAACTRTPLQVATTILAKYPGNDNSYASQIVDTVMAKSPAFEVQDCNQPWGTEVELVATVDDKLVTPVYTVADTTVASADGAKLVGLKKGSTEVTATLNGVNGTYTATATVTFTEKAVTPTLNADGMLNLETAGEQTTISVYASTDTNCENALYTETTEVGTTAFDIHESIVSYKESLNIKSDRGTSYIVKVQSANYVGVYTSKTYMAVCNDTSSFPNHGKTQYAYGVTYYENVYMYLTEDIDVSSSFGVVTWGNQVQVAMYLRDLDGRGHSISYTYDHNVAPNYFAGFAAMGDGAIWKNVHVVMNLTLAEGTNILSALVGEVKNSKFINVYFEANIKNMRTADITLARTGWGSEFINCIIEINNLSGSVSGTVIRPFCGATIIENTAVIDASATNVPIGDEGGLSATNVYKYSSLQDFINGENGKVYGLTSEGFVTTDFAGKCYENWSDAWEVTETDVKLLDQVVATTLKTQVTPVINNDGLLTLNTNGENTAVKVYASNDAELANVLVGDEVSSSTYDIRDLILSYMEEQSASNGEYSYIVTVESDNYVGTYETETFVPVTQASEFVVMFNNAKATAQQYANKYYYLANDIDISKYAARNTASFAQTCLGVYTYLSLDGRGHTITNTYEHTLESSNYVGLAGYMGHGSSGGMVWRNVHYKANIALNSNKSAFGVFAFDVGGYTFYNCYIEANIMNNSSATTSVINLRGSNMYDCIIELNKASVSKSDVVILGKGEAVSGSINNCAIINSSSPNKITTVNGGENIIVNNCSTYGSFADYANDTSRYADWKYNWIESGSAEKQNVTPTFENGLLSLNTNGEFTTVKLYASSDTAYETVLATATAIKNIDLNEFIISYMEQNVKTYGEYNYSVVVESDSYQGVYAHEEKFVPISNEDIGGLYKTRFAYLANVFNSADKVAGYNFFLVEDIDVSASSSINSHAGQKCIVPSLYLNLDGRGHTITNTVSVSNSQQVGVSSSFYGKWKNVHFKLNATLNAGAQAPGLFAYYMFGTLENSYIELNVLDNSTHAGVGFTHMRPGGTMKNCVVEINRDAQSTNTNDIYVLLAETWTNCTMNNVVIIKPNCDDVISNKASNGPTITSCYQYDTVAEFISGTNGLTRTGETVTSVNDGTKCYAAWNSVWSIANGTISLFGQQIKTVA